MPRTVDAEACAQACRRTHGAADPALNQHVRPPGSLGGTLALGRDDYALHLPPPLGMGTAMHACQGCGIARVGHAIVVAARM